MFYTGRELQKRLPVTIADMYSPRGTKSPDLGEQPAECDEAGVELSGLSASTSDGTMALEDVGTSSEEQEGSVPGRRLEARAVPEGEVRGHLQGAVRIQGEISEALLGLGLSQVGRAVCVRQ